MAVTLVDRVGQVLTRYSMLSAGDHVGVAVSGGPDSVALLHVLHRLASRYAATLMVLHVNHKLRGAESDSEEAFVQDLAGQFGLSIAVAEAPPAPGNLEQEARRARRAFFFASMQKHALQKVALGHTRSDQAETVLYRLFRGSGLTGLAGMRPVTNEGLIRPLLACSRDEIRSWAQAEGIAWCEDSSNLSRKFARNRLRLDTLPALAEAYNPNLEALLAGTARLAQDEESYWNERVEAIYKENAKHTHLGSFLQVGSITRLHRAEQRRLIRRAIAGVKGDLRGIDLEHVDAILAVCQSGHGHDRVLLPGVDALRSFETLLLTEPGKLAARERGYHIAVRVGHRSDLPYQTGHLYVRWVKPVSKICANFKEEHSGQETIDLDGDALALDGTLESLAVRNWQPGDEILRPGHKTAEKLKSLFQENRVLLWERKHWPVMVIGTEIVWAGGFGCAEKFKASQESRKILRLVFDNGTPARQQ